VSNNLYKVGGVGGRGLQHYSKPCLHDIYLTPPVISHFLRFVYTSIMFRKFCAEVAESGQIPECCVLLIWKRTPRLRPVFSTFRNTFFSFVDRRTCVFAVNLTYNQKEWNHSLSSKPWFVLRGPVHIGPFARFIVQHWYGLSRNKAYRSHDTLIAPALADIVLMVKSMRLLFVKIKIATDAYRFCLTSGGKGGGKRMGVTSVVTT